MKKTVQKSDSERIFLRFDKNIILGIASLAGLISCINRIIPAIEFDTITRIHGRNTAAPRIMKFHRIGISNI